MKQKGNIAIRLIAGIALLIACCMTATAQTISLPSRIANLETAVFGGPNVAGNPVGSTSSNLMTLAPSAAQTIVGNKNLIVQGDIATGLAGLNTGSVQISGTTSGTVTETVGDAAGTYNWVLPATSGSSGNILASGGGGTTQMTWDTTTGSGTVLALATSPVLVTPTLGVATATTVAATATASFVAGTSGAAVGQFIANNATSGTVTIAPPTGALGSAVVTLPALTGSLATGYTCGNALAAGGTCANTALGGTAHVVYGTFVLGSNTSAVVGVSPAFPSSTSWNCVANDTTTRANPVQAIPQSGSAFTITNTTGASDTVSVICIGN